MGIAESRRVAREVALLAIYCHNIREVAKLESCVEDALRVLDEEDLNMQSLDEEAETFLKRELEAYKNYKDQADALINEHLEGWDVNRLNTLDLSILELAVCELLGITDVNYKITISEAVNLSKKYSSNKAPFLINAVLDAISATLGLK